MSSKSVGCKEAFNAGIRSGETEAAPVIRELIESVTVRRRSEGVEVVIKGRLTTPILRAVGIQVGRSALLYELRDAHSHQWLGGNKPGHHRRLRRHGFGESFLAEKCILSGLTNRVHTSEGIGSRAADFRACP
jgi:hypothetical protein